MAHGNFGSIEGDGAAAMRYTEARLKKFAEEVYLKDLDKTVDFVSNYDETEKEPEVLPVRVPNLLINGAEGIAVGMSTSIPPHNLGEVADAVKAYIDNRLMTVEDLMEYPSRTRLPHRRHHRQQKGSPVHLRDRHGKDPPPRKGGGGAGPQEGGPG